MNYHQRANLQDYQMEMKDLEREADNLTNSVIPSAQFRLEDIGKRLRELRIMEAEINLEIAKEG